MYTKRKTLDRRFACNRPELALQRRLYIQQLIGVGILGFLAGSILTKTLFDAFHPQPLLDPRGTPNLDVGTNKPAVKKIVKDVTAMGTPCDYDPITYIRCSGEKLGKTNQEIITMIRIAKAESSMNPRAKNKNSSASGLFQIIAGTWYSNDCIGDKWDFKDNTNCAWKIQTRRGFQPWVSSSKVWNK